MSKLSRFALGAALLAAAACDKNDTRDNAENAAEAVRDRSEDLADKAEDLKEAARDDVDDVDDVADRVEDLEDETVPLNKEAIALRDSQKEFEYQRLVRVQSLRTTHAIIASQPNLILSMAQSQPLAADDRAELEEKLQLFQMRLDESANLIQGLDSVEAKHWEERDRAASDAMSRLEDAREDAWEALDDADRMDDVSMR